MQRTDEQLSARPLRPNAGMCRCGAPAAGDFNGEPVCLLCGKKAEMTAGLGGVPGMFRRRE